MNRRQLMIVILIAALPAVGALLGRLAAPALAGMHPIVRIAEQAWSEGEDLETPADGQEQPDQTAEENEDVAAFRATGLSVAQLYAQAYEVRHRFGAAAAWFGAWCGLVTALKIAQTLKWRYRREYDADPAHCLACGRCYGACPVDRERKQQQLGEQPL